ncbi:MAG TPA: hypothetical protein GX713_03930 [Mollicutes bacterium]|nr:hypothetical protein [Mollicutes bacterium]
MTKEINLRNTSNKVSSNYISKISEIAGEKVKNIIIEATVIDHKNIEIDKGIVTLLKLKDSSGTIDGMLIGKRDDEHKALVQSIENNNTYKFRGTVVKAEAEYLAELETLTKSQLSIKDYITEERMICISALEKSL